MTFIVSQSFMNPEAGRAGGGVGLAVNTADKMKVLIAEDEAVSRLALAAALKRFGYECVQAADGQEAREILLGEDPPSLAVLDWMMPKMDGLELCRELRRTGAVDLPYIILLTARGAKEDLAEGLSAGANDYIVKPYDNLELKARLEVGSRVVRLQKELYEAMDSLRHLALTDCLTQLPNRRAILAMLEEEMSRAARQRNQMWISFLDLDRFKAVNDTLGHQAGDLVLAECSRRIRSVLRPYDAVGRFGGEEFLIVVPLTSSCPRDMFERIRLVMSETPMYIGDIQLTVTVSQGVVAWNGTDLVDELLAKADETMYRAKQLGRDRVEFFEEPGPGSSNPSFGGPRGAGSGSGFGREDKSHGLSPLTQAWSGLIRGLPRGPDIPRHR